MATNNFSSNIKRLRKSLGKTQDKMADDLMITRAALGAYEEGRANPRLNAIIAIADYFKITVDELIR